MKAAKIALVIVFWSTFVNAVTMGHAPPLPRILPFCSGAEPGLWDLAGLIVIAVFLWRWGRSHY